MEQKKNPKNQNQNKEINNDRLDLVLISNAKQIGLSFKELNNLRVRDFVEMIDIETQRTNGVGDNSIDLALATQKDIDKLLS
ncbi:hypothetical protein [Sporohalobacter salinus]|uniref:hypothetical protein n=1 Tax=Sporohalobacter salinus TaxID=1494606 RepID=UPI00195FB64D|nr:hypothetical protein [Sporohalobacter salinus]MBM7624784.1 hypothetical protein [Sporohalobacter salinus]